VRWPLRLKRRKPKVGEPVEPIIPHPATFQEIVTLLNSGGSAATIVIVYIAWQLKAKVEGYLDGVNETLSLLSKRLRKVEKHLGLHDEDDDK
jgi:hypothetical protein